MSIRNEDNHSDNDSDLEEMKYISAIDVELMLLLGHQLKSKPHIMLFFPILKLMPNYPPRRQRRVPIACCVLHNFIRKEAGHDRMIKEFQVEDMIIDSENTTPPNIDMSARNIAQMCDIRDKIATDLWRDFI
ncbi:unnamed protein product [Prunus armeniaca]|uniref:DDE Tnp4 domain-containing protein n=1 Tax=Prunus armeniaca TaxID=36596 RepID=A0A6J5WLB6_PRUAR|nr:unnamed protein product [Prunus armeniaca]